MIWVVIVSTITVWLVIRSITTRRQPTETSTPETPERQLAHTIGTMLGTVLGHAIGRVIGAALRPVWQAYAAIIGPASADLIAQHFKEQYA